jgi:hypothetical protein
LNEACGRLERFERFTVNLEPNLELPQALVA